MEGDVGELAPDRCEIDRVTDTVEPLEHLDDFPTHALADDVQRDLALRAGPALKDSTLTSRRLGAGRLAFFASPEYLARRGKPKQANDPAHDWLLHRAIRRYAKPFQAGTPRFLCDDMLLLRELARRGGRHRDAA